MGDIFDLEAHRASLRASVQKETIEGVVGCPKCGDMFSMVVPVPVENLDVDMEIPYAIICQHCSEPYGYGFLFNEDDEEYED